VIPLTPVLVQAPWERAQAENLAGFVKGLDGTVLRIIPQQLGVEKPCPDRNNSAFHQAAIAMKGQPFIWLETDTIPRKPGWVQTLTTVYYANQKEFLLSSDLIEKTTRSGAAGVYGPNSHWLIPENTSPQPWDAWMVKHLSPLSAFTPLIQYNPGPENQNGVPGHRFPQESDILRSDAVLFQSDRFQELITGQRKPKRFYHTGDLGDIIAALPVVRELGGGELVIGNHPPNVGWRAMEGTRFNCIKPLAEAQPYIAAVKFEHQPAHVDYDLSGFRQVYSRQYSLSHAQAKWLNVSALNLGPWLHAKPSDSSRGKIVVARTGRYRNPRFPWRQLVKSHGSRMIFVGLADEFQCFLRDNGGRGTVTFTPTETLLEMAALIKGSDLFIGNQSCPCWIAMGLGHKMIQETHDFIHDSIVPRENARFFTKSDSRFFAELGVPIK
jgi:hypothetical protein